MYGKRSQWSVEEGGIRHGAEWKRKHMKKNTKKCIQIDTHVEFHSEKTRTN